MMMESHIAREEDAPVTDFHRSDTLEHRMEEENLVYLEISACKLSQLLLCGAVSVMDFRCLNHISKCRVRMLCLYACAHRLNESDAASTM